jgi:hypothetical protein
VKGVVKSRKEAGWSACGAQDAGKLRQIVEETLRYVPMARGRGLVCRLAPLRRLEGTLGDFPISREYRVFLYRQRVLAFGFYWDDDEDSARLSTTDEQALLALASEAARRLRVPFLMVDAGQQESGEWTIIEVGDAQFAGLSRVSPPLLWNRLIEKIG